MWTKMLLSGIFGLTVRLTFLLIAYLQPTRKCLECDEALPKFRKPANRRQALWGGWTCSNCGTEHDRRGRRTKNS